MRQSSLRGRLRRPLGPLDVNGAARTQPVTPQPANTSATSSKAEAINSKTPTKGGKAEPFKPKKSTSKSATPLPDIRPALGTSNGPASRDANSKSEAESSSGRYALVDVSVEDLSDGNGEDLDDFDPFSVDAVPFGEEEADLNDCTPIDLQEAAIQDILGAGNDDGEIGVFLEDGANFTESDLAEAQDCVTQIVNRAIELRSIACAKIDRLDRLRKGKTTSAATGTNVTLSLPNQYDDIFTTPAAVLTKYKTSDEQLRAEAANFSQVLRMNTNRTINVARIIRDGEPLLESMQERGLYALAGRNKETGKIGLYLGSTKDLAKRLGEHLALIERCRRIYKAGNTPDSDRFQHVHRTFGQPGWQLYPRVMYRSRGSGPVPMYLFESAIMMELRTLRLSSATYMGMSNAPAKEYLRASGLGGFGSHLPLNRSLPTLERWYVRVPEPGEKCHFCAVTLTKSLGRNPLLGDDMEQPLFMCTVDSRRLKNGLPNMMPSERKALDAKYQHLATLHERQLAKAVELCDCCQLTTEEAHRGLTSRIGWMAVSQLDMSLCQKCFRFWERQKRLPSTLEVVGIRIIAELMENPRPNDNKCEGGCEQLSDSVRSTKLAQNAVNGLWLNTSCQEAYCVGTIYTYAIGRPEAHIVRRPTLMRDRPKRCDSCNRVCPPELLLPIPSLDKWVCLREYRTWVATGGVDSGTLKPDFGITLHYKTLGKRKRPKDSRCEMCRDKCSYLCLYLDINNSWVCHDCKLFVTLTGSAHPVLQQGSGEVLRHERIPPERLVVPIMPTRCSFTVVYPQRPEDLQELPQPDILVGRSKIGPINNLFNKPKTNIGQKATGKPVLDAADTMKLPNEAAGVTNNKTQSSALQSATAQEPANKRNRLARGSATLTDEAGGKTGTPLMIVISDSEGPQEPPCKRRRLVRGHRTSSPVVEDAVIQQQQPPSPSPALYGNLSVTAETDRLKQLHKLQPKAKNVKRKNVKLDWGTA